MHGRLRGDQIILQGAINFVAKGFSQTVGACISFNSGGTECFF
jgi:hypothetical protein